MYRIESTVYDKNEWQVETLPMPLRHAEKLYKLRLDGAEGRRRYRMTKV
jgi:hypothetical protein